MWWSSSAPRWSLSWGERSSSAQPSSAGVEERSSGAEAEVVAAQSSWVPELAQPSPFLARRSRRSGSGRSPVARTCQSCSQPHGSGDHRSRRGRPRGRKRTAIRRLPAGAAHRVRGQTASLRSPTSCGGRRFRRSPTSRIPTDCCRPFHWRRSVRTPPMRLCLCGSTLGRGHPACERLTTRTGQIRSLRAGHRVSRISCDTMRPCGGRQWRRCRGVSSW